VDGDAARAVPRSGWSAGAVGLFAVMVIAWAGNYLFVRVGEAYVAPLWLASLRAGIGALGVGAYLALRRPEGAFARADMRDALLLGIPNTAVFLGLWFVAAPAVAPGETAVIVYTFPLWVAVFAPGLLGSHLGRRHGYAVGLGFVGVVLVSQPWNASVRGADLVPFVELLAAAVSWAIATLLFQRRFAPEKLARANGYQLLGGAVVLLAVSLLTGQAGTPLASPDLWIAALWLGLLGTAFAYGVWFHLLRSVHASALSAYSFLVPLTALGLSAIFEGERLGPLQLVGVLLVVLGIYLVGTNPLSGRTGRGPALEGA
jgi:drug/metabolite transporter (DMT)-like permease